MATARYSLNKNKYLLPPEAEKLRELLSHFEADDLRNSLVLSTALRTGGRALEILNLTKQDLNQYDETIFLKGIKGSNDRELPLHPDFFRKLWRWSEQIKTDRLFDISYDRLYQVWLMYRPVPKKFHCLRHTFAIELYQKTKDIRLVQVALGHRNITNTMIYAEYAYSQNELKKLLL